MRSSGRLFLRADWGLPRVPTLMGWAHVSLALCTQEGLVARGDKGPVGPDGRIVTLTSITKHPDKYLRWPKKN